MRIYDRLRGKDHLSPVTSFVGGVLEELERYDPALFVCFNHKTKMYEIHSLRHLISTFAFPCKELDHRLIKRIYDNDLRHHTVDQILDGIEVHNAKIRRSENNRRRDQNRELAHKLYEPLSKIAWGEA